MALAPDLLERRFWASGHDLLQDGRSRELIASSCSLLFFEVDLSTARPPLNRGTARKRAFLHSERRPCVSRLSHAARAGQARQRVKKRAERAAASTSFGLALTAKPGGALRIPFRLGV